MLDIAEKAKEKIQTSINDAKSNEKALGESVQSNQTSVIMMKVISIVLVKKKKVSLGSYDDWCFFNTLFTFF